jgi:hypothetical protein
MVAGGFERIGNIPKERIAVVLDGRGLAVHQAGCPDNFAAKDLTDALVTEADTQDRNARPKLADDIPRNTSIRGIARTRGNDNMGGLQGFHFLWGDYIVAINLHFRTQFANILGQVMGE